MGKYLLTCSSFHSPHLHAFFVSYFLCLRMFAHPDVLHMHPIIPTSLVYLVCALPLPCATSSPFLVPSVPAIPLKLRVPGFFDLCWWFLNSLLSGLFAFLCTKLFLDEYFFDHKKLFLSQAFESLPFLTSLINFFHIN